MAHPEQVMKNASDSLTKDAAKYGFSWISQEAVDEARRHVEQYGMVSLQTYMEKKLDEWKDVKVRMAITGQSGAGKSSFINKVRNVRPEQDGAAPVNVIETTRKPTMYLHPDNQNIELWDLPGVGTPNFPQSSYLQQVGFETFDCFIILSETRFTENDMWLASSVLKGGKRFYFARTKIDNALRDDKEDKGETFNEIETLSLMHKDIVSNLDAIGNQDEKMKVYLITNRDSKKFDFPKLIDHVLKELPDIKRGVMVRALRATTKELVLQKKIIIRNDLWMVAALSGVGGAIPIPGASVAVDIALLVHEANKQKQILGVDEHTLETIAKDNGVTLAEMKESLKIAKDLLENPETWIKQTLTGGSLLAAESTTEEIAKMVPFFGSIVAGGLSAATTYYLANQMLEKHTDLAIRCLEITAEKAATENN